jgi:hypothetical protein
MRAALDLPDALPGIVMCIHTFGEYLDPRSSAISTSSPLAT